MLTWLVDYANDKLRPENSLKAGALITTGTLCGAIELASPAKSRSCSMGRALHLSLVAK